MSQLETKFPRPMVPADFGYSALGAFAALSVALGLSGLLYLVGAATAAT